MSRIRKSGIAVESGKIRVCTIEDHAIVRAGIRMLVEREECIEVIFEATTASGALEAAQKICPDVILLDISLGSENGLNFIGQLIRDFAPVHVLVVTATDDVDTHLMAMEAGASGVVLKEQAPEILVKAIHAVNAGEPWMGHAVSIAALRKLVRAKSEKTRMDPEVAKIATLTPREREVVGAVASGFNGPRIASEFGISQATVRHHITSILSKLEVSNKLELAVYAFRHGLRADQSEDTALS
jgi:two-component system, NarL family, nitrate/nitrite response regulator NarL